MQWLLLVVALATAIELADTHIYVVRGSGLEHSVVRGPLANHDHVETCPSSSTPFAFWAKQTWTPGSVLINVPHLSFYGQLRNSKDASYDRVELCLAMQQCGLKQCPMKPYLGIARVGAVRGAICTRLGRNWKLNVTFYVRTSCRKGAHSVMTAKPKPKHRGIATTQRATTPLEDLKELTSSTSTLHTQMCVTADQKRYEYLVGNYTLARPNKTTLSRFPYWTRKVGSGTMYIYYAYSRWWVAKSLQMGLTYYPMMSASAAICSPYGESAEPSGCTYWLTGGFHFSSDPIRVVTCTGSPSAAVPSNVGCCYGHKCWSNSWIWDGTCCQLAGQPRTSMKDGCNTDFTYNGGEEEESFPVKPKWSSLLCPTFVKQFTSQYYEVCHSGAEESYGGE